MTSWIQRLLPLAFLAAIAAGKCTEPGQRRAWHTFTNEEKLAYIEAELCLMELPAQSDLPFAQTRFDELQAAHALQAYATHYVGAFLPFHRIYMHAHETVLRNECGYKGHQPYWYEQMDSGKFSASVVFDPVYGFGGNGNGADGCIADGPFANYTNHIGPNYTFTDNCINRYVDDEISNWTSQSEVDKCLHETEWDAAWNCIHLNPHDGGHAGVGGAPGHRVASPGDPLFYLHHTWLDKVWWDWQKLDKEVRTTTISGPNVMPDDAPFPPLPDSIPKPTGADGDPGTETTMTHVLNMYGVIPNQTIADVMDIQGGYLCYEYVEPPEAASIAG
ncbi:hypothetical protein AJ79_03819 [Helicocarpus griseus UAMH5409]|uniref:Tyrosinase copper-binding domain-containing protein n=1 Tax=Helicocarpus griseus UAMH5409 TaxID=1447875 RepID=A0A2B7XWW1_9EURO|nr:hypothetical protein AJ79_03819 [Helicocarpus griseus UAMH5409]